jgi:hypothetical protein
MKQEVLEFGVGSWKLEVWNLDFGIWNLDFGICNL